MFIDIQAVFIYIFVIWNYTSNYLTFCHLNDRSPGGKLHPVYLFTVPMCKTIGLISCLYFLSLYYFHYLLLKDFCSVLLVFNPTEKRVDSDLTVELRELRVLVKDMETKLNATEQQMEKRLNATEQKVEKRLKATEQKVEKLQSDVQRLGKENPGDV